VSDDMSDSENDRNNRPVGNARPPAGGRMSMPPEIEENLKRIYQASLTEAVPDRFVQLLAQLRDKGGTS
jgi:Anti-sigma factor NepR